jgi:Protein of unknown function (DUF3309)
MIGTIFDRDLGFSTSWFLPRWSQSRNWGYGPSSGVGLALLLVVILLLLGRI